MLEFVTSLTKKKLLPWLVLMGGFTVLFIWGANSAVNRQATSYMVEFHEVVGQYDAAIILGAKVYANGALGAVVRDRADMAIKLYKAGKVKKLLASADNSNYNYNETKAIYIYLIDNGVTKNDIFLDFAGFDTYDSMYRAKHNFLIKTLLIPNHLNYCPRSLYLARHLGIDAWCVTMPKWFKPKTISGYYRESFAKVKARIDIMLGSKAYFAGEDTYPIDSTGNAVMFY